MMVTIPTLFDQPEPMVRVSPSAGLPTGGKGFTHEAPGGGSPEWYTPAWIFEAMGVTFDLDPCHPLVRLPWIPATAVMTVETDGLKTPWPAGAFVWMNPPYGKETPAWLAKLVAQGNGVALVFARTDCRWFHEHVAKSDAFLLMDGRVKFVDENGKEGGSPGSGSMLVAYGQRGVDAIKTFQATRGGVLVTGWAK